MPAQTRADVIWNRVIAGFAGVCILTLVVTGWLVLGQPFEREYSQATPDDVLKSASAMVRNGDARLLPNLIYADTPEMRSSLKRLGVLLASMQKLAGSIKDRFPEEIAKYRSEADAAIASGKPPAVLMTLTEQLTARDGPPTPDQEAAIRDLVARIFADPYAWISDNESRLTTLYVTDDLSSIMLDGKPVAGVGLTLKLEGDKWYLALPTNIPPVNRIMPKAPEQWRMIDSLISILNNTARELDDDVQNGRLHTLRAIGDKAQEKVIFPGALWVAAYGADMDARQRIDRNLRQYRERQRAWVKSRGERETDGVAGVSEKLAAALTRIAGAEIPAEVRARKARRWGDFGDADFEQVVGLWLEKHALRIDLRGPLAGASIDASVEAWERGPGASVGVKRTSTGPK